MKKTSLIALISILGCGVPDMVTTGINTSGNGGAAAHSGNGGAGNTAGQGGNAGYAGSGATGGEAGIGGFGAAGNGGNGATGGYAGQGGVAGDGGFSASGNGGVGGAGANGGYGGVGTGGEGGAGGCNPDNLTGLFATYSQGGWRNNPVATQYLDTLSGNIIIGDLNSDYALFDSAEAIKDYLPEWGTPSALHGQYINPTHTPAGVLGGQTLALTLNLLYNNDAQVCGYNFANLEVADSESICYGMSVEEVLNTANEFLAGSRCGLTFSKINKCAEKINLNFLEGLVDNGYLGLPE